METTKVKITCRIPRMLDGTVMSISDLAHCLHLMERMASKRTRPPEPADYFRAWAFAWLERRDDVPPVPQDVDDDDMELAHGTLLVGATVLIDAGEAAQLEDGRIALIVEPVDVH